MFVVKPLINYLKKDDNEAIKKLLDSKELKANSLFELDHTLLEYALRYHSRKIIELLIEQGANPFSSNGNGNSPFSTAIQQQDIEWIKYLVVE